MDDSTLCLGWDVGGWLGSKDGLAAALFRPHAGVEPVGTPCTRALGGTIARGELSVGRIADMIGVEDLFRTAHRVVLAIDAPLGLPGAFTRVACAPFDAVPTIGGDLPEAFIDHPLAFRITDRAIYRATGKRPLSPTMDSLANNVSKARAACSQFRANDPQVRIIPFEADDSRVAVIEVYPALWKPVRIGEGGDMSLAELVASLVDAPDPDQRDAQLCTLSAACYEATRCSCDQAGLPRVILPPAEISEVKSEGWIYAPVIDSHEKWR